MSNPDPEYDFRDLLLWGLGGVCVLGAMAALVYVALPHIVQQGGLG